MNPGTNENPLRVAIVGAGPSGFYAAERLQKEKDLTVEIDLFDRLPTPYGLVRGGVAPDHQKIKSVTKVYERIMSKPNIHFYGNVEFGSDLTWDDMADYYHAVIFTVGAQSDRKLGIPGEDLPGSNGATEFVAWYNGHPDYRHLEFDLSQEAVAVIGVGNVAMDVARILARSTDELKKTDIAPHALEALSSSNVKRIYIVGRRGPVQAKFTNPEIKEMGEMEEAEPVVDASEVDLDPLSQEQLNKGDDRTATKNIAYLKEYAETPLQGKKKQIIFKFLKSPVEIIGEDRVEAIKLVRNELYLDDRGSMRPRQVDEYETIPVGLVFRSVGYRGEPLPGIPFHDAWGTIPHEKGRVLTQLKEGKPFTGAYTAGWIKRGPSGVIGTNKPDAVETVETLLSDLQNDDLLNPSHPERSDIETLLNKRGIRFVTFDEWKMLDQIELERGEQAGCPRIKFCDVDEMLAAIDEYKANA